MSDKVKVIYELHVKGLTMLNLNIPKWKRGKFMGVCDDWMIKHLQSLNVDAVQIMPVFNSESSYWGYDTNSWTELNPEYGTDGEFERMVTKLQAHGIKVILDVVYNHTAPPKNHEENPDWILKNEGPIDGVKYYDWDVTGCGNTVDVKASLPIIMSSINYWMQLVDGMRFDLAGVLGREGGNFNPDAEFFKRMKKHSDNGKILIAEPYDLGEYSLGRFPSDWLELNTKVRDQIRDQKCYLHTEFDVNRSVAFVTCHDGFTLHDLVCYDRKHNDANGENSRDGSDHNLSHNCGCEGETTDPQINEWRRMRKEHMMNALYSYTGVIMLLAGDEVNNSQSGNNNVWNQDNPTGYINW